MRRRPRLGTLRLLSGLATALAVLSAVGAAAVLYPGTPLPDHWNPVRPLDVSAPVTPVTRWKLARSDTGAACFAALETGGVGFALLDDLTESEDCQIRDRVSLTGVGGVGVEPVETRCTTALRLALWARHGLEPAAQEILGARLEEIHHLTSYNCRGIRTPDGESSRMSTHATADAIDITGVTLTDGRRVMLPEDWGRGANGAFLRAARDSSCRWFRTTLGPDYNSLHADHFHLQTRGYGLCR